MSILSGSNEAKIQISTADTAFVGRVASAKLTMSTRSSPPINYYKLEFEDNIKSLKGSAPTTMEFEYSQQGKGGKIFKADGSTESIPAPKEPQSGQYYVAIYDSERNVIDTLIEINQNDISLL